MPDYRDLNDNLRRQAFVMLNAGVVGGSTKWARGHTVSANAVRSVLWALWMMQVQLGPDVRFRSWEIGEAAGVTAKTTKIAVHVLQHQGVLEILDPRLHISGRGTRWRIVWEKLVAMVPADKLPTSHRKSAA